MNLTFTYKFSACAPEAHAAVSGWGEHRLIIGNNLQAGWEWRAMGWRTAFLAGAPSIIGAAQQPTFQLYSSFLFRTTPPLLPRTVWKGKNKWGKRKILLCWCDVYVPRYPAGVSAPTVFSWIYIKKPPLQSLQTNTHFKQTLFLHND